MSSRSVSTLYAVTGALVGSGLMYFLDPQRGHRRRMRLRDKSAHYAHRSFSMGGKAVRDIAHRAKGLVAETRGKLHKRNISDDILKDSIRSELGRIASHLRAIDVTVKDAMVTLSGAVASSDRAPLLACVGAVRGVRAVRNQFHILSPASATAHLLFPPPQVRSRPRLRALPRPTRTLLGVGGVLLTLASARRKPIPALAGGTAGLMLLGRSLVPEKNLVPVAHSNARAAA